MTIDQKDIYKMHLLHHSENSLTRGIPLGLMNHQKYLQNTIIKSFSGIENIAMFLDDMIVLTKKLEEHYKFVEKNSFD